MPRISASLRARKNAADLIHDSRTDLETFQPQQTWQILEGQPRRRSAWRTYREAANRAARLSARALAGGRDADARTWAQAFLLLDQRMSRAMGLPIPGSNED